MRSCASGRLFDCLARFGPGGPRIIGLKAYFGFREGRAAGHTGAVAIRPRDAAGGGE